MLSCLQAATHGITSNKRPPNTTGQVQPVNMPLSLEYHSSDANHKQVGKILCGCFINCVLRQLPLLETEITALAFLPMLA